MRVTVGGKSLFFDVEGEGHVRTGTALVAKPTLIVLHGAPGSSDLSVYKPYFSALTDVAQVITLDLCGSGRSDDSPDGVYSLERWADDLVGFCDVLGIDKPVVLGNSAGGMVAGVYASRHPNHPAKVILSSTQAKLIPERCIEMFERLGGPQAAAVARAALIEVGDLQSFLTYSEVCIPLYNTTPQTRPRASIFRQQCAEAFHLLGGAWHTMDFRDDLRKITCPTLVIAGAQDPVTPLQDSLDIVALMNPSVVTFEQFDNAGHGVWLDEPDRAFDVLRRFIARPLPNS